MFSLQMLRTLRIESYVMMGLLCSVLLAGCVGASAKDSKESNPTPEPTAAATTAAETEEGDDADTAETAASGGACADGDLTIGDLPAVQEDWQANAEEILDEGKEWQDDAVLVEVEPVCLVTDSIEWLATYYSADAGLFEVNGMEVELKESDNTVPFEPSDIDFAKLHGWLTEADYRDELPFLVFQASRDHAPDGDKSGDVFFKVQISFEEELYLLEVNAETGEITDH